MLTRHVCTCVAARRTLCRAATMTKPGGCWTTASRSSRRRHSTGTPSSRHCTCPLRCARVSCARLCAARATEACTYPARVHLRCGVAHSRRQGLCAWYPVIVRRGKPVCILWVRPTSSCRGDGVCLTGAYAPALRRDARFTMPPRQNQGVVPQPHRGAPGGDL